MPKTTMKTAKQLMNKSTEDQNKENLNYLLADAETDLKRAIEIGKREVSSLERTREQSVKNYILGGELRDLLQFERDIDSKNEDITRLEKILSDRF